MTNTLMGRSTRQNSGMKNSLNVQTLIDKLQIRFCCLVAELQKNRALENLLSYDILSE